MLKLTQTQVQELNCKPVSAFRNVHHKGSKNFGIQFCVSTSKEKSNTTNERFEFTIVL